MTLSSAEYVSFLETEYLSDFIRSGGSGVKFAVADDGDALRGALRSAALAGGYAVASVDARDVRVHLIDKVFHDVARQIDWNAGAIVFVQRAFRSLGFEVPENTSDLTLERIAAINGFDQNELRLEFQRTLQSEILRDFEMSQEFRRAMIRICQAQVDRSDHAQADKEAVLSWLRGELRLISALRQASIFQKVARHNARDLLFSLARWLVKTGHSGLVLDLDIRRCAVSGRPAEGSGVYYSKAACLDAYEVLRQLIDATDELSSCFVLVTTAPETLTDPRRGIEHSYPALKMRIWNEVRDRHRPNPFAALIRLDAAGSVS
ncbi:MAG: BREX system ATP-binding domain-containing protein [Gaiellales bacterium]